MSSIGNRFFVTALDDGSTLHGNLSATAGLSQAWNGTSAVPDWSQAANQPTIYLTLLSGAELVQPSSGIKWFYNGTEIQFSAGGNITSRTEYYLASSANQGVTVGDSGWSTSLPTLNSTNKYLWNYEVTVYANGETLKTQPKLIYTYEGTAVSSITEYYLASPSKIGVTTSTTGWSTSIPTLDATNKYLWNYTKITLSNSTNVNSEPLVIGFYTHGVDTNFGGLFQKTVYNVTYGGVTKAMPALKIIGNLAGYSGNVDMDTISFKGNFEPSGGSISFDASIQVRITTIAKGGYFGVLNFLNGISDITADGQNVTVYADLYGGEQGDRIPLTVDDVVWYINDVAWNAQVFPHTIKTTVTVNGVTFQALQVGEDDVIDHAIVRCDFKQGTEVVYSGYVGIDDMQDPEYMYIQYNGANGNAASLRKSDDHALFYIWVGKNNDPALDPAWTTFKLKLLDGDGKVVMTSGLAINIPNVDIGDTEGWRTLNKITQSGSDQGKAYVDIAYDTVKNNGKNLTGIVMASTT